MSAPTGPPARVKAMGAAGDQQSAPSRVNAWNCPISPHLLVTICICLGDAVAYCSFLQPLLHANLRLALTILFSISFVVVMAAGTWTMTVDPVDIPEPVEEWMSRLKCEDDLEDEDEKIFCELCRARVHIESKHCQECNKCVAHFDHHCQWLNTCIGSRNYHSFYVAILAKLAMVSIVSIAGIAALVHTAHDSQNPLGFNKPSTMFVEIFLLVINIPLTLLIAVLAAFHTYISITGITTFDWLTGKVTNRKEELSRRKHEKLVGQAAKQHADLPDMDSDFEPTCGFVEQPASEFVRTVVRNMTLPPLELQNSDGTWRLPGNQEEEEES